MLGELLEVVSPDGTRLGVERVGGGPPLLAVHGGTADRSRWAPVVAPLASRYAVHLLDRRGRGASHDEAPGEYALELEVADVVAVVESIGEPLFLLGHSYGALIGMEALLQTDLIAKALLYEPPFNTPGHVMAPQAFLDELSARLARGDREGALEFFYADILHVDPTPLKVLPVWQARLAAVHTLDREARIGVDYTVDPSRFSDVAVPVRFLQGELSPPPFHAAVQAAHAAMPGSEVVVLRGHGHTMIDADPEGFVDQVVSFFGQ